MTDEQEKLVTRNVKLVGYMVNKYFPYIENQETREDAFQEGCVGLIHAALSFDITKGAAFTTYAARCIINQIRMYFRKNNYDGSECQSWSDRDIVISYYNRPDGETAEEFCQKHNIRRYRLTAALYTRNHICLDELIDSSDTGDDKSGRWADIIADPLTINGLDITESPIIIHIDDIILKTANTFTNNTHRAVWFEYIYARIFEFDEEEVEGSTIVPERTQKYLALKYGYAQSYISRLMQKGLNEMRKIIDKEYLKA